MSTATKRHRYTFRTRLEAEQVAQDRERINDTYRIALYYAMNGDCKRSETTLRAGDYTVRICGPERCDGGVVIITYAPDGQRPSHTVYDREQIVLWRRSLWQPSDDEQRSLAELLGNLLHTWDRLVTEACRASA